MSKFNKLVEQVLNKPTITTITNIARELGLLAGDREDLVGKSTKLKSGRVIKVVKGFTKEQQEQIIQKLQDLFPQYTITSRDTVYVGSCERPAVVFKFTDKQDSFVAGPDDLYDDYGH